MAAVTRIRRRARKFWACRFTALPSKFRRRSRPSAPDDAARVKNEWQLRYVLNLVMSLLLQILPWIWICKRWDRKLGEMGAPSEAREFAALALLFGTTPAILMDVFLGHSLVAFFSMLALWRSSKAALFCSDLRWG